MPNLNPRFNWGSAVKNFNEVLYNQLNDAYSDTAHMVNIKTTKVSAIVNPPADAASNATYEIGDIWVNRLTDTAWILTSRTTNTAVNWQQIT